MGFRDERLWEILKEKAEEEDQGLRPDRQIKEKYLAAVESVCEYGVLRADTIRDTFPMYTLHNETHICNVMRLMESLLGDEAGRSPEPPGPDALLGRIRRGGRHAGRRALSAERDAILLRVAA